RISFVGPAAAWREGGEAAAAVRVDAEGGWICPGFVDIHVHGGGGADVMDADPDALRTMARTHARYGTTSFLATTVTAPHEKLLEVAEVVARMAGRPGHPAGGAPTGGAQLLGDRKSTRLNSSHVKTSYA